jgi:hypothetical protein
MLVAFNLPARFCVTLIVEPPVTVTVPAVWAGAALSSVRVTDTAPVGRVEPPTVTVAVEAVAPVDVISTEEPPSTTRTSPAWAVCVNEIAPVVPLSVVFPPVAATVWDEPPAMLREPPECAPTTTAVVAAEVMLEIPLSTATVSFDKPVQLVVFAITADVDARFALSIFVTEIPAVLTAATLS